MIRPPLLPEVADEVPASHTMAISFNWLVRLEALPADRLGFRRVGGCVYQSRRKNNTTSTSLSTK